MSRSLLDRFLLLYPDFRERLRRHLGSADLADEALSEVYVKLSTTDKSYAVRDEPAYLFRLSLNTAFDLNRSARRLATMEQIETVLDLSDPSPGAGRSAEARQEVARLEQAIATLTERRRNILIAARIHGRSCREIAGELGLSTRTVEMELRSALEHCAEHLNRKNNKGVGKDFANDRRKTSIH